MGTPPGDVTVLLHAWGRGDRNVEPELFELVMPDLQKIARCLMRRERPGHSLEPTALLNEAYCRLVGAHRREWQNRRHFFAIAARAMRRLLIDHARGRPKAQFVDMAEVEEWLRASGPRLEQALAIDALLTRIEASHPDWVSIIEMKFFLGFTDEETAESLGIPLRSLQRKFGDARRWLYENLESANAPR